MIVTQLPPGFICCLCLCFVEEERASEFKTEWKLCPECKDLEDEKKPSKRRQQFT